MNVAYIIYIQQYFWLELATFTIIGWQHWCNASRVNVCFLTINLQGYGYHMQCMFIWAWGVLTESSSPCEVQQTLKAAAVASSSLSSLTRYPKYPAQSPRRTSRTRFNPKISRLARPKAQILALTHIRIHSVRSMHIHTSMHCRIWCMISPRQSGWDMYICAICSTITWAGHLCRYMWRIQHIYKRGICVQIQCWWVQRILQT